MNRLGDMSFPRATGLFEPWQAHMQAPENPVVSESRLDSSHGSLTFAHRPAGGSSRCLALVLKDLLLDNTPNLSSGMPHKLKGFAGSSSDSNSSLLAPSYKFSEVGTALGASCQR